MTDPSVLSSVCTPDSLQHQNPRSAQRTAPDDHHSQSHFSAAIVEWFSHAARPLPWREADTSAWAVLVSEFMLQQTQVDRVIPKWEAWIARWPSPAALAADPPGEAVRAWDRLGYPRRALWLHAAATRIAEQHNNVVPSDVATLTSLTGVGDYTARAVAAFAYGERHPVVDTNTRRVLARAVHGQAAAGMPHAHDLDDMAQLLPEEPLSAQRFNAGMMELGAIVCTARTPLCSACPIAQWCQWRGAGYPDNAPEKRPRQASFAGSDRQVRGRILNLLRQHPSAVTRERALSAAAAGGLRDAQQAQRAYDSLLRDGLIIEHDGRCALPE